MCRSPKVNAPVSEHIHILKEFLCSHGEQVTKSGNEYRWKRHDSLTIQGNKWFRHSQSKGGYPVEFVMECFGKTFPEAMLLLIGEAPANNGAAAAPSADFRLPPRNRYVARAMAYLHQRNIPEELVQEFYKEGLIYEDAWHHNIVFVGKDETGIPRYAHCKGTEGSFRMDVQGSDNEEFLSAQCVWQEILWEIKSQVSVREKTGGSGLSNEP